MSTAGSQHVGDLFRAQRQAGRTDVEATIEVYKVGAYSGGAVGLTAGQAVMAMTVYSMERRNGLTPEEARDEVFLAGYVAARRGAFA